jgi:hypothetical protein
MQGPSPLRTNIPAYVAAANELLGRLEQPSDRLFFVEQVALLALDPSATAMFRAMANRVGSLSADNLTRFEAILLAAWREHLGEYDDENQLAEVTRPVWSGLSDGTKCIFLRWFISFVNSQRRPGFAQRRLARDMLLQTENQTLTDEVLRTVLKEEFEGLKEYAHEPNWRRKLLEHLFENTKKVLNARFDTALDAVAPLTPEPGAERVAE